MCRGSHDLLALWLFIRLASQLSTMLNTVVCFSCLGDRAPCLLDAVDSFSSRSFNTTFRWISMCYSSKFGCFGTQQFLVLYCLSCISSCNAFVVGLCSCFLATSSHFKCVDVAPSIELVFAQCITSFRLIVLDTVA